MTLYDKGVRQARGKELEAARAQLVAVCRQLQEVLGEGIVSGPPGVFQGNAVQLGHKVLHLRVI